MNYVCAISSFLILFGCTPFEKSTEMNPAQFSQAKPSHAENLSLELLNAAYADQPGQALKDSLAQMDEDQLRDMLSTDTQRKTFWLNLYNAYILILLKEQPERYEDKDAFFTDKQIPVAGTLLSFDDIEHGIIRGGQAKYSLGYFKSWFRPAFERKFQVGARDFRIHFALNCGAKSCPPVRFYRVNTLHKQLEQATQDYLTQTTQWEASSNTVRITRLFHWFRGDFGGMHGVEKILKTYTDLPDFLDPHLEFLPYDWTLDLDNFVESQE